jgi:hypothetical protein
MHLLARYGVPEYWLVDLEVRTIEVYELRGPTYVKIQTASGDDVVRSMTVAGVECRLADTLYRVSLGWRHQKGLRLPEMQRRYVWPRPGCAACLVRVVASV